jgi:Mg-chelatase subunit ChlI
VSGFLLATRSFKAFADLLDKSSKVPNHPIPRRPPNPLRIYKACRPPDIVESRSHCTSCPSCVVICRGWHR